jgi:hypothetical protein
MPRRSLARSALSTLVLVVALGGTARAECLVAPRGAAPQGQHWFFRTDKATQQKCWYLRARDAETTGATQTQGAAPPALAEPPGGPATLSSSEQQQLFQEFLRWQKQRGENR